MILLLESIHPDALAMLEGLGEPVVFSEHPTADEYSDRTDLRAIVTRGIGQITSSSFDEHPELKVVARCGVGLDNIDTEAAARADVAVVHAPGSTTYAVAEHALMLMLALARRVIELDSSVKAGDWAIRGSYEGMEMRGKRLGVVGLGAIGSRIAEFGGMLGMDVVCATRRDNTEGIPRIPLEELLRTSDVVQLCMPLTDQTRHLIGPAQLKFMKPTALLINTARGALIVSTAVELALESGHLTGYAADVMDPEPPEPTDSLATHPRSIITPHIAALTDVTYREICVRTVTSVVDILTGTEPNPASVYSGATG